MIATAPFFVAGGTVPPGSPSYVERSADRELLAALLEGTYCYVLNSRQMGKSSLAVRTIARLQAEGVRTAFVDLTRLGGATISAEQWYSGLLAETGRALGLRVEAAQFLRERKEMGPAQRYLSFLHEVALSSFEEPVVVMIDEIDAVRSLPFSTDELFAGIRQLHNGRASDEALSRLTFCLLGAALPSDLIRDPRITPFNVGRRIELRDFTPQEAAPFAKAIGGPHKLQEVLKWTGGHPFLTQAVCAELASEPSLAVNELVQRRYLDARARDTDTNLVDVGNRLLGRGDPSFTDDQRADVLSLFAQLRKRGIDDDESNPSSARIKMSGVARLEGGRLTVRNRIYDKVFGADWIRENMPGQELRRQRKAFWKGAIRSGGVAATVISVVSFLAIAAVRAESEVRAKERDVSRRLYEARVATAGTTLFTGRLSEVERLLALTKGSPDRNVEWGLVQGMTQVGLRRIPTAFSRDVRYSPDGRTIWLNDSYQVRRFDAQTLEEGPPLRLPEEHPGITGIALVPGASGVIASGSDGSILLWPEGRGVGKVLEGARNRPSDNKSIYLLAAEISPDGHWFVTGTANTKDRREAVLVYRTADWRLEEEIAIPGNVQSLQFSPDGRTLAAADYPGAEPRGGGVTLIDVATWSSKGRLVGHTEGALRVAWTRDGKRVVTCSADSTVALWDVATRRKIRTFSSGVERPYVTVEAHALSGITFGNRIKRPRGSLHTYTALDFSPDGKMLYTCGMDGHLGRWDVETGRLMQFDRVSAGTPWDLRVSPDGSQLTMAGNHMGTVVVDLTVRAPIVELAGPRRFLTPAMFSPSGRLIGCGDWEGYLWIWEVGKEEPLHRIRASGRLIGIGWRSETEIAAVLDAGGRASVDLRTGQWRQETPFSKPLILGPNPQAVVQGVMLTDGELERVGVNPRRKEMKGDWASEVSTLGLIAVGWNGGISIRQADTFEEVKRFDAKAPWFQAWSQDGRTLLTSDGAAVHLIDVRTWEVRKLLGHDDWLLSGCFTPDGKRLVTASYDGAIKIWSLETGECLLTLPGVGPTFGVTLSPKGDWLLATCADLKLRLYPIAGGETP
jgi:WD40 repeat protein